MSVKEKETQRKYKTGIPEEAREHVKQARDEMRLALKLILPEGFLQHRRSARREMMLAFRSILDAAIESMEKGEGEKE